MPKWTPLHVEDALDGQLIVDGKGWVRRDIDIHPTKEQYEQMQQGYMCIGCFELQENAFPESCGLPGCSGYPDGFPMRARQRDLLEEMEDEIRRSPPPENIWLPGKG